MGQQPSSPQPGRTLKVIGAGLPRTGTSSFNLAISHLLNGPSYHGGTQATLGGPENMKSWTTLLNAYPPKTPAQKEVVHQILRERLDGYIGVTDSPCNGLVEELLELYPDAVVICTIRDKQAWIKSMSTVSNLATMIFLRIILFPLPTMRHFPAYINALRHQWIYLYGQPEPATEVHWDNHIAYLKRVVPKEKLFFFDVREGWGPLCETLGTEVPRGLEFPRVNDGEAIEDLSRRFVAEGLKSWGLYGGGVVVGLVGFWWARMY